MAFIESKIIETGSGSLCYRINGGESDHALVFIHGAVGDSRLFRNQLKYFGSKYMTIAVDLPGHGKSGWDELPTIDTYIDAIDAIVREEELNSVVFVGHSMGGGVCFELIKRNLFNVKGMILVATAPVLPVPDALMKMAEDNDLEQFSDVLVGSVFSKKTGLLMELARKGIPSMDMDLIRNDMEICKRMDYSDLLDQITVPVLIIANSGDKIISHDFSAAMNDQLSDSRFVLYNYGGHVPFFEYGEVFNNSVDLFLDEVLEGSYKTA